MLVFNIDGCNVLLGVSVHFSVFLGCLDLAEDVLYTQVFLQLLFGLLEAGFVLRTGQTVDLQKVQKEVQPELEVAYLNGLHEHAAFGVTDVRCHDFLLAG